MTGGVSLTTIASYAAIAGAAISGATSIAGALSGGGSPKADTASATKSVDDEAAKAARKRSALLDTVGGQAGSQLQPGQVSNTQTLFGN